MTHLRANLRQLSANARRRFALDVVAHPDWLRVLVEGDSWFAFPGITGRRNIVSHLAVTFDARFALYRIDAPGDTLEGILTGKSRDRLRRLLKNNRYDFELLLFSGGGNDIIDNIDAVLQANPGGWRPGQFINADALENQMEALEELWLELIDLRDRYRPRCRIVTHSYDYAQPDGRAVRALGKAVAGPWLKAPMENKDIPVLLRKSVIRKVMRRYRGLLDDLAGQVGDFHVVNTQGTLSARDWEDEIHPSGEGFRHIAGKIATDLRRLYPGMIA